MSALRSVARRAACATEPVALATVVDGSAHRRQAARAAGRGARRDARRRRPRPGRRPRRARRARSGLTSTRHYGEHGEAREDDVSACSSSRSRCRRAWSSSARSTSPPRWPSVAKVLGYRVDGVRRPRRVRDRAAVPDGRRGRQRLARPLPREGRRRARPARRGVRADPRPQVRRSRDRGRGEDATSATSARWARGARTRAGSCACARRARRRRDRTGDVADRSRHRRPHARRRRRSRSAPRSSRSRTGRRAAVAARHCAARSTDRNGRARGSRNHRQARGGRGRVEGSRLRRRAGAGGRRRAGRDLRPRRRTRSTAAAERIGGDAVPIVADVSTADGAAGFVRDARAALGGIDILVANAGGPPAGDFAHTTVDQYLDGVRAQLPRRRSRCVTRRCPTMREQQWGRVVAITSIAVRQPIADADPLEHRPRRADRIPEDARARGRGRRRDGQLVAARAARDRARRRAARRRRRPGRGHPGRA